MWTKRWGGWGWGGEKKTIAGRKRKNQRVRTRSVANRGKTGTKRLWPEKNHYASPSKLRRGKKTDEKPRPAATKKEKQGKKRRAPTNISGKKKTEENVAHAVKKNLTTASTRGRQPP